MRHARHGGRRLPELLEPLPALLGRDAALLHVDVYDENRIAIEPRVAGGQGEERSREEARSDDEGEGQRDLQHDEPVADAEAAVVRHAAALFLDGFVRRHAADADRGRQAEDNRCRDRHEHREPKDAPVERQVEIDAAIRGRQLGHEHPAAPIGEDQSEGGARGGQERRLGEQLPGEPQSRGAERQPDAQLMASRDRARQQQVGDVGAGDEEHETNHDQDRHQWLLIPAAERRETVSRRE